MSAEKKNTESRNAEFINDAIGYIMSIGPKAANRSAMQRRFKIGYVRAGELLEEVLIEIPTRYNDTISELFKNIDPMKETEQTLLDKIKEDVAAEMGWMRWDRIPSSFTKEEMWDKVCERYATAKSSEITKKLFDEPGRLFTQSEVQASCEATPVSAPSESQKPDFEKLAKEFSYTHALVDSDDHTTALLAYRAGCEHVWNTHVVPLQENWNDLKKRFDEMNQWNDDAYKEIESLQEKLKIAEHLKELDDDAIITLQRENEELKYWKGSAIEVIGEWEKVFDLIDNRDPRNIGRSKAKIVFEEIERLKIRLKGEAPF